MTEIIRADYLNPVHAKAIVALMQTYARDIMGGGDALPLEVTSVLIERLAATPGAVSILAFANGQPAGLLNAFAGFSTFAARPLLNIHDVVVAPAFRGQGLARALMAEAETVARERGCAKLTLEVLEGNATAQRLYRSLGYGDYVLDPEMGRALFWQKRL
ncbi:GNAT family N-acetyltransferase [Asticcacaulis sp. DW145]|uniref:GNAT family N-acetyltransferase n=1 Tax=Asticcacaulis currens TaxID=2984210 RepID=A0ABT5IAH2_9CAUL|nr:GNAT family N-acetyltransferase [Asticcacaulis currens]MDC7693170.1 GNAT family N-acetyltransferase [Asticcacaulis currens]BEV09762.1 GNAT family N-acetyltransferase [Asticcacaulis sp. DW145]